MATRPAPPTILLTGFEPFGGAAENSSWEAAALLHGRRIYGHLIVALRLPVVFGQSLKLVRAAIRAHDPALVLCIGQADGRAAVSFERVAINVDDARIADNAGTLPIDAEVIPGGPAAYFATLPIKAMRAAVRAAGIPAEISQSAGTYVCNHVFYGLMHAVRRRPRARAGFVHVPCSPAQAAERPGTPSLPVEIVAEALRIALRVALAMPRDARIAAGAEH